MAIDLLSYHDIQSGGDGTPSVVSTGGSWVLGSAPSGYDNTMTVDGSSGALAVAATLPGGDDPTVDLTGEADGEYNFVYTVTQGLETDNAIVTVTHVSNADCANAYDLSTIGNETAPTTHATVLPTCMTLDAQAVPSNWTNGGYTPVRDVWFEIETPAVPTNTTLDISATSNFAKNNTPLTYPLIEVYSGSCGALSVVTGTLNVSDTVSSWSGTAVGATTYYVRLAHATVGTPGDITLQISM